MSRHNGRGGKHGAYNAKHNDRQFDVSNAENIHVQKTDFNLYWDWQNKLRTHAENVSGQYPSFVQIERDFYEQRYGPYLAGQAQRNIKSGHAKRNRTVDDLLADVRVCPEETIYQIGKEGDCPPPEVLTAIVTEFFDTIRDRYGSHVHVLDWALHLDETSPHIHARQVFDVENRYGEIEPKQEKALEALGIPLPEPDKKPSKVNNRKVSFDGICRGILLKICREHGLDVETEAIYGGKVNREKNDYIIEKQREEIDALRKENETLASDNAALQGELHKKAAELDRKLEQLADADTVLEAVTDAAYVQAVRTVTEITVQETQKADRQEINRVIQTLEAPVTKMRDKQKTEIRGWLDEAKTRITKASKSVLTKVLDLLKGPEYRRRAKEKIKEQVRPSIQGILRDFAQRRNDRPQWRKEGMDR